MLEEGNNRADAETLETVAPEQPAAPFEAGESRVVIA
jgi:hypothetical protein